MHVRTFIPLMAIVALAAGCTTTAEHDDDHGSSPPPADRVIAVTMTDAFRYEPDSFTVQAGETVTFEVTNDGAIVHEFLVGDEEQQAEFAEEMASGGGHHDGEDGVSVEPGATERFTHTFEEAGDLLVGCHEPGHYEAGMVAPITVTE
jgi:uncharacterized cupredoxin-like copper-binding protein